MLVTLLAKIFIRQNDASSESELRSAYGKLCSILGIVLNIFLFAAKLFIGIAVGAISIMSDAFNNITDAASSVITLLGFKLSEQKADKDHPFGHGRFEYISGFIVSLLIMLVGFELGKSSFKKILTPTEIDFSIVAVIILLLSICVKAYMAFYNFKISKKIGSSAMQATATDSLSDCVATGSVLVCLIISRIFSVNIDAYCGLAISAFIMFSGLRAAKETMDPLLGQSPDKDFVDRITTIVFSYNGVVGIHDLIVHDYGVGRRMISLHAEVSADANIIETHDMIDNIEKELREKLFCEAVIHMDPIVTSDVIVCEMKEKVASLVTCIDKRITIHDFRMVEGPTHTNVIFDAVVPFDLKKSDKEIIESIQTIVKTLDENCFAVVSIDKSYV